MHISKRDAPVFICACLDFLFLSAELKSESLYRNSTCHHVVTINGNIEIFFRLFDFLNTFLQFHSSVNLSKFCTFILKTLLYTI